MSKKEISKGAEAVIIKVDDRIIKKRISKGYRHKELDMRLRKHRTRIEAKILERLREKIERVPKVFRVEEDEIEMEYIEGVELKELLEDENISVEKKMRMIGESAHLLAQIHSQGISHQDYTPKNIIISKKGMYVIDFGLSFFNARVEDKAIDLYMFLSILETLDVRKEEIERFKREFMKEYLSRCENSEEIEKQVEKIKRRRRYVKGEN